MSLRQSDVVIGTALVVYIVFFSMSPPTVVRTVLSHPVGVAASFGAAIYTTLYYSKPVGALLIVALLASMTRVTEYMTDAEKSQLQKQISDTENQINELSNGNAPDKEPRIAALNVQLQRLHQRLSSSSKNTPTPTPAVATPPAPPSAPTTPAVATPPARSSPPITTPTAPAPTTPAVATPPAPPRATPAAPPRATPPAAPKPVMACNIENFAPF